MPSQSWTGGRKNAILIVYSILSYGGMFFVIYSMLPKKQSTPPTQDDIISKNIFDILGLAELPSDQKQQMLQKMVQIVYQRVVARIMDVLPEDAIRQLKLAIDAEDEKTATALLAKYGLLSFSEMMTEEALFMKYEMDALQYGDPSLRQH